MRIGGTLDLRIVQRGPQAPELHVEPVRMETGATLDRENVVELRDACDAFLAGEGLPR